MENRGTGSREQKNGRIPKKTHVKTGPLQTDTVCRNCGCSFLFSEELTNVSFGLVGLTCFWLNTSQSSLIYNGQPMTKLWKIQRTEENRNFSLPRGPHWQVKSSGVIQSKICYVSHKWNSVGYGFIRFSGVLWAWGKLPYSDFTWCQSDHVGVPTLSSGNWHLLCKCFPLFSCWSCEWKPRIVQVRHFLFCFVFFLFFSGCAEGYSKDGEYRY